MPNVVIVKKDLPVNSLQELVDYVKANPGKVVYGSQGNGATPHLTANMFMNMTGTQMVHVPYRGETLVLQDMLGGHVDLFFGNVSAALALWRDGRIKVLAVLDKQALGADARRADHSRGGHARSCLHRLVRGGRAAEDGAGAARPRSPRTSSKSSRCRTCRRSSAR